MIALLFALAATLTMHVGTAPEIPRSNSGMKNSDDPTLVVINARIWTANPDQPWAEALVISNDRITFVGSTQEARSSIREDVEVIDAEGRFITPGFIDSHVHFLTGGLNLSSVQLRDAATPQEFTDRIGAYAATVPPGTWILGGDWDHTGWGGELPERSWIDSVTTGHPVWINRLDGHMALANSMALKLAKVPADQPDIEGGEIVRNESGKLTGILKDNAMTLVSRAVPDPTDDTKARALAAEVLDRRERGAAEVERALGVVLKELLRLLVLEDPLPLEEVDVVHEVDLEPDARDRGHLHLQRLGAVARRDLGAGEADDLVEPVAALGNRPIAGHDDPGLEVAHFLEVLGQLAGESGGRGRFGEGGDFACYEQYFHALSQSG